MYQLLQSWRQSTLVILNQTLSFTLEPFQNLFRDPTLISVLVGCLSSPKFTNHTGVHIHFITTN